MDQVRVEIVEQRPLWAETERDRQSSAEWFHETSMAVRRPQRLQVRNLPPLAARPLERRLDDGSGGAVRERDRPDSFGQHSG